MTEADGSPVDGHESRCFFWDGGFLTVRRGAGIFPTHAHHAFKIIVAAERPFYLSVDGGPWLPFTGVLVRPDILNGFDAGGGLLALLLVDPESVEGRRLWRAAERPIGPLPPHSEESARALVHGFWEAMPNGPRVAAMVHALLEQFCLDLEPPRRVDERILTAVAHVQTLEPGATRLEDVARAVHLSPSRLAHLFKEQVGISFGRYLLWRRLTRAMVNAARGQSLSRAAHAAGFADAAHFTRTFRRMFGVPPSTILARHPIYEIPAPFQSTGEAPCSPERL